MSKRARSPAKRRPSGLGIRVIVCGGRDYEDRDTLVKVMDQLDAEKGPIHSVVHGAARGADSLAKFWAQSNERPETGVKAQWERYGPAAGPIRNAEMLDYFPDFIVAFPGGRGTADMVARGRKRHVPIIHVDALGKMAFELPKVANPDDSGSLDLCLKPSPSPSRS